MRDFVKELANKDYTYLPYLWIIRLKTKGMYPSLDYWLKTPKVWKMGITHIVRILINGELIRTKTRNCPRGHPYEKALSFAPRVLTYYSTCYLYF